MNVVELLGLPAVGKSYVVYNKQHELKRLTKRVDVCAQLVEAGLNFKKIKNITVGLLYLLLSQHFVFLVSILINNKTLLLCERIGRNKCAGNILVDEGVMQACWAVLCSGKGVVSLVLVSNLIKKLSSGRSLIIYVSANKESIFERAQQRLKDNSKTAYNYHSIEGYKRSRDMMARLLKMMRRCNVPLKYLKN